MDREPGSGVRPKKGARDRLIRLAETHPEWVLGFEDETWFSRFERPSLHSWEQSGQPMRLLQKEASKDDPEPKALSCYGLYLPELEQTWLRFVDGRPVSANNHAVPLLVLPQAPGERQEGPAPDLGQRKLAQEPSGTRLDRRPQPQGQR